MRLKKSILFILFFSLFISVCSAQKGTVEVNQSEEIDQLLELKKEISKSETKFKIQIYNGNRSGALRARTNFWESFNEWPLELKFETPNYKIWIGNFKTKLEADRALLRIKKKFGNAFILRPKNKT
ncbi:MAG: SPOR domain-containing protein [Flavobacteriaceae bacterium]|nr:SPOR domain-containing protein [Bacteroidia bacterium]NNK81737.1 SPOR domain-containing protein [Flavobacteriaceae bacterium]